MDEKFREEVADIVCKISGIPVEKLTGDANFVDDLGIESIMAVDIVSSIEKKYNLVIPEDRLGEFDSLDSCVEIIKEILLLK